MSPLKKIVLALSLTAVPILANTTEVAQPSPQSSFLSIDDKEAQAMEWAKCSASFDLLGDFLEAEKPATAQKLHDLSRGAKVAVMMSLLSKELNPSLTPEAFNAKHKFAQLAMTTYPEMALTNIYSNWEIDEATDSQKIDSISKNTVICMENIQAQQMYINLWRELAQSGLLQLPD